MHQVLNLRFHTDTTDTLVVAVLTMIHMKPDDYSLRFPPIWGRAEFNLSVEPPIIWQNNAIWVWALWVLKCSWNDVPHPFLWLAFQTLTAILLSAFETQLELKTQLAFGIWCQSFRQGSNSDGIIFPYDERLDWKAELWLKKIWCSPNSRKEDVEPSIQPGASPRPRCAAPLAHWVPVTHNTSLSISSHNLTV